MKSFIYLLFFVFVASSCQTGLGDTLTIALGESRQIGSEGLKVAFSDIMDSRCPTGVECIAAGEARVSLEVTKAGASQSLELTVKGLCEDQTGPCGSQMEAMGYQFKLLYVSPYPAKDLTIGKGDYKLTLVVEKG